MQKSKGTGIYTNENQWECLNNICLPGPALLHAMPSGAWNGKAIKPRGSPRLPADGEIYGGSLVPARAHACKRKLSGRATRWPQDLTINDK